MGVALLACSFGCGQRASGGDGPPEGGSAAQGATAGRSSSSGSGGVAGAAAVAGAGGSATAAQGGALAAGGGSNSGGASSASRGGTAGQSSGGAGKGSSSGGAGPSGNGGTGGRAGSGSGAAAGRDGGAAGASNDFTFFAFADAHAGQNQKADSTLQTAMAQMRRIDPNAAFGLSGGDLVEDSTTQAWSSHDAAVKASGLHPEATSFNGMARYFAAVDNHDQGFPVMRNNWHTLWDQHLSGQASMGHDGTDGVYYTFSYQNALFIALDSIHPSAAQDTWLAGVLSSTEAQNASVKIAFFHEPVYICTMDHPPFAAGLPWVDSFEKNGVKLAFTAHSHIYERSCPMLHGRCSSERNAVVYQGVGPLAANDFRVVDRTTVKVSGKDAAGNARSDDYACTGTDSIWRVNKTNTNTFCHVSVSGCRIAGECYVVSSDTSQPFDSWEVDGCR
ncbi:MAG TPA: hypothetical protein VFQ35_20905 [Polyangiaceae bacterium]|nr:hypothetical protein [Polyangiaceae bacterium]